MNDDASAMPAGPVGSEPQTYHLAALYRFAALPDFEARRQPLLELCEAHGITGTLLLAAEGVNGTIAGPRAGLEAVIAHLRTFPGFDALDVKWSAAPKKPFIRLKVRLKREIVTMGVPDIDPNETVGTYVEPHEWNELIERPDVVLIDTRNDYEVAIGTFKGAVDPKTATFREFPQWAEAFLQGENRPKIAMFCTGGIRCEKSTALLKSRGFDEVYHLKGGILKYLETVPPEQSLWQGECFVFDQRVSVGHELKPGPYQLCSLCREPFLSGEGAGGYARALCTKCQAEADETAKRRAAERSKQIDLARKRGQAHLGTRHKRAS